MFTIIIYQVNSMSTSSGFWTLLKMCTWGQSTFLAVNQKKNYFLKNAVLKESFLFVASDVAPILYNRPCIYMYQRLISLEGMGLFKNGY